MKDSNSNERSYQEITLKLSKAQGIFLIRIHTSGSTPSPFASPPQT